MKDMETNNKPKHRLLYMHTYIIGRQRIMVLIVSSKIQVDLDYLNYILRPFTYILCTQTVNQRRARYVPILPLSFFDVINARQEDEKKSDA